MSVLIADHLHAQTAQFTFPQREVKINPAIVGSTSVDHLLVAA
jgi:hypothetical protein